MSGADVVHRGRGAVGPPLLPGHLPGGGLLQGGLLPVPRHLRGAHHALQREGAGGGAAPLLPSHGAVPVQQRRPQDRLPGRPGDAGGHGLRGQAAHQAAEDDRRGLPRRAPQEAAEDELHHLGDDLQPGRPAHEAAAHQLGARRLRRREAAAGEGVQDVHRAHEQVCGGPAPQATAAGRGREDGRTPASQTEENEFGSLHVKKTTQT